VFLKCFEIVNPYSLEMKVLKLFCQILDFMLLDLVVVFVVEDFHTIKDKLLIIESVIESKTTSVYLQFLFTFNHFENILIPLS
jgi:hypothetical protein